VQPSTAKPLQVRATNGGILMSDEHVEAMELCTQGYMFHTYMRVLDIGGYDWLKSHSPMICHWELKTIKFQDHGQRVHLQGVKQDQISIDALSLEQFVKWSQGNDIWALAMVQQFSDLTEQGIPAPVAPVLSEFQDVFAESTELPPHRQHDHTIPLLPNAAPINSRPYHYSPLHKDEIEQQVKQLLQSGMISTSTSPFASPVLLVQKKDGSWWFCVDYRRLNSITVKNKFHIPLIEEILDELTGAKFFTKLDFRSGFHQVRMSPKDEFKTIFKTHHGHYQFQVMPFGLTNAPATFQCIMNSILEALLRKFVIMFMDDILVYSTSL
jgi:hypothetical protein